MARRQGLMFPNVPDQLSRVQNAQGNVLRAASLHQPKRGVTTKSGKQLNMSGLASGMALGEMAVKGYDALNPYNTEMTKEAASTAKEGLSTANEALAPGEMAEAKAGVESLKVGEEATKGVAEISKGLATETAGGSTAGTGLGSDIMAAGSAAWEGLVAAGEAVGTGVATAANYLWTLLL